MAAQIRDHAARHPGLFDGWADGLDQRSSADWWRDPELWRYAGWYRSDVEEEAVDNLFSQAGHTHMARKGKLAAAQRRQGPAIRRGSDGDALRPLRDVLASRGQQLSFAVLDDGGVVSFIVPRVVEDLTEVEAVLG